MQGGTKFIATSYVALFQGLICMLTIIKMNS